MTSKDREVPKRTPERHFEFWALPGGVALVLETHKPGESSGRKYLQMVSKKSPSMRWEEDGPDGKKIEHHLFQRVDGKVVYAEYRVGGELIMMDTLADPELTGDEFRPEIAILRERLTPHGVMQLVCGVGEYKYKARLIDPSHTETIFIEGLKSEAMQVGDLSFSVLATNKGWTMTLRAVDGLHVMGVEWSAVPAPHRPVNLAMLEVEPRDKLLDTEPFLSTGQIVE